MKNIHYRLLLFCSPLKGNRFQLGFDCPQNSEGVSGALCSFVYLVDFAARVHAEGEGAILHLRMGRRRIRPLCRQ